MAIRTVRLAAEAYAACHSAIRRVFARQRNWRWQRSIEVSQGNGTLGNQSDPGRPNFLFLARQPAWITIPRPKLFGVRAGHEALLIELLEQLDLRFCRQKRSFKRISRQFAQVLVGESEPVLSKFKFAIE